MLVDLLAIVVLVLLPIIPAYFLHEYVISQFVLYPMVPAYFIFKYFPATAGTAQGTFRSVHFRFVGAFAGYLLIFIMLLFLFHPQPIEAWQISGTIELKGQPGSARGTYILYRPPDPVMNEDGSFTATVYTQAGLETLPTLIFLRDGYRGENVGLRHSSFGKKHYTVKYDNAHKILTIVEPVVRAKQATIPP